MTQKLWMGWAAAGLMGLFLTVGCTEESTPGGPGAATNTTDGEPADESATFTLELPTGATNIEQGKTHTLSIGVDRGEDFTQDVTLNFEPPEGITIDPATATIASTAEEVDVMVKVDPTVAPGEKIINVTGEGGGGPPAEGQLKIEVTEASDDAGTTDTPPATETPPATDPNLQSPPAEPVNPEGGAPQPQNPNPEG